MNLFADLVLSLFWLVRAVFDAATARHRRRYTTAVDIDAPVDVVWAAASAHQIVFEGPPRVEITTRLRPGTSDTYDGVVRVGEQDVPMAYREIEMRPRRGLVIEILEDGSAPSVALGRDYYVACTFEEKGSGTRLSMSHELTHTSFLGRILVPIGARQNARRLRDHCEAAAGTASPLPGSRLGAALMTGALTYASFIYLFDWQFAAVLLALLVVHECGHALAMRWVGMPVQGIYFIPFFGGVAVSAAPHESEAERGFVALMGPGLSLVSTGAFVYAAAATGEPIFAQLALVSAILNGINLAPVLPLDGGHVLDAALSSTDPGIVSVVNMLALIAGVGVSVYLGWYVLTGLLLLTAPAMLRNRESKRRRAEPISLASRNWLVAGYLATVAFYIAVATHYLM
jgi:Zn-dependent protease